MNTAGTRIAGTTLARRGAGRLAMMLIVIASAVSGCVTNPATGEKEFSLMSREQEIQLGQQGDQEIVAEFGVYDDQAVASYVNQLGQKIAAKGDDPSLTYTFRVLDAPVVNAFALPGGYVYVTRGLLAYMENEAQLAMVLGHEIGHVTARHAAKQYTSQQLVGFGLGVGSILFQQVQPYLGAIQTGLQLLFLSFSRDDERQADELGVQYATRVGYKASEGAKFFEVLKRMQDLDKGSALPTWASTHPDPGEREQTVRDRAAYWAQQLGQTNLTGDDPSTLVPRLQNMIFGQNPRNGFVQGGIFYHPELRFQMPVPSNWQVGNFASQVQMMPEAGDAAILLMATTDADPATAAQQFVSQNGASVVQSGSTTINGLPAYRLVTNITSEDGTVLTATSFFIRKSGRLYVMHGYSTQARYGAYASTFDMVGGGFQEVTNTSVLNVQPYRLNVFQASRTDQFASLVQANTNAGLDLENLAILNQRTTSETIPAGTYLKDVR